MTILLFSRMQIWSWRTRSTSQVGSVFKMFKFPEFEKKENFICYMLCDGLDVGKLAELSPQVHHKKTRRKHKKKIFMFRSQ